MKLTTFNLSAMKKKFLLIIGVLLLCFIGTCIYLVGNISAQLSPIEKFNYQGDMQELLAKMKVLETTNPNIKISYGSILGNKFNGFAYDIVLKVKYNSHNLLYDIKLTSKQDSKCELLIIGAHDLTGKTGGYGINATGMKELLTQFRSTILDPLKNNGIILTPL